jgi:large subunit ribosomal protein L19
MVTKVISTVNIEERKKLDIHPGDTVRVWQKIEEDKGKFRLQAFEGIIMAHKHGREAGATFTVRKVVGGIGVERTFPLFSPMIDSVERVSRSKVRRSKLYFVRRKAAKEIRHKMRKIMATRDVDLVTPEVSPTEVPATAEEKVAA